MPPFCAPSPSYLLSEAPPLDASPATEQNEEDERAQMVAALVTALTDAEAEAAAEESNADDPEHQRLLATQAYNSLCFDFPIASTNSLAALTSAFRASPLGTGKPIFPITERFISGLRYLVSIEFTKQSTLDGPVAVVEVDAEEREGESISDLKLRCKHLFELCGCVFLLAPSLRLAVVHKDDGASLHDFLAAYDPLPADVLEQDYTPDDVTASNSGPDEDLSKGVDTSELEFQSEVPDSTIHDEVAAEMDDDDSDWEALETFTPPSQAVMIEEPSAPRHTNAAAWSHLMSKVALLTGSVSSEVFNTGVWEELQLTDHLIEALNSMRMLERKQTDADVSSPAKLYAEFLSDHLLSRWSTSSSEVGRVVSALMVLTEPIGEINQRNSSMATSKISVMKTWNLLVVTTLARLCSKVGGYPAKRIASNNSSPVPFMQSASFGSRKYDSLPSPTFVRSLWQSVFSNLRVLQGQLADALGSSESFSHLEMLFWIFCFMVKFAPGNIDLRATLLEGGIFRIALQLFVKVGRDPKMEPLRHFLLLSMASSPALAEFAAQVPSFIAAMSAAEFSVEGSSPGAHAVIWPLILRAACAQPSTSRSPAGGYSKQFDSNDAEDVIVDAFDGIVKAVADDTTKTNPYSFLRKLVWVHWLLLLLEEATSASSSSTFKLWKHKSPLDNSINRCQIALGSILVHATETASISFPRQKAIEKKSEDLLQEDPESSDDSSVKVLMETFSTDESKLGHPNSACETEFIALQEKLKDWLPSMLLQLKLLSALTKGNREAKID